MINCIIVDDDLLSIKLIENFIKKVDFLNLDSTFTNPISALSYLSVNKVDLIFLDIEMPEMNGIEFIKTLHFPNCQIILITSHKEFAIEAFENSVTDYLLKPFDYHRFYKAINKAKDSFDKYFVKQEENDSVFVKKGSTMIRINISDIIWAEAVGDYVKINTEKDSYVIHSTMIALENKLSPKDYLRVHRSFIVRIDKIDTIENDSISYNKKLIPIGKTYRSDVYKRLRMI
ncbi:MAG: LytTR family DNA-binding domain-containing protein [Bacteroidia bacterium]